jgi:hypothetical protein
VDVRAHILGDGQVATLDIDSHRLTSMGSVAV